MEFTTRRLRALFFSLRPLCEIFEAQMTRTRIRIVLEMIKFEHSVFALPFALVGALLAARAGGTFPTWRQLLWIVVAMVGARSAAMTMNRIADVEYDRRNPRTANRALPKGELSIGFAWTFTLIASAVLVLAAWQLNPLALKLSPSLSRSYFSTPTPNDSPRGRTSSSAFASASLPLQRGSQFAALSIGAC